MRRKYIHQAKAAFETAYEPTITVSHVKYDPDSDKPGYGHEVTIDFGSPMRVGTTLSRNDRSGLHHVTTMAVDDEDENGFGADRTITIDVEGKEGWEGQDEALGWALLWLGLRLLGQHDEAATLQDFAYEGYVPTVIVKERPVDPDDDVVVHGNGLPMHPTKPA